VKQGRSLQRLARREGVSTEQIYIDHSGEWARVSEIRDYGCLLVRPDHHVAWRATAMTENPKADLLRVLRHVLVGKTKAA